MTFSDGNFTREILNAVYQVEDVTTKRKFATTRRRMANHEIKRGGIEKDLVDAVAWNLGQSEEKHMDEHSAKLVWRENT
jgi:hypothetical protein